MTTTKCLVIGLCLLFFACSPREKASWDTQEQARQQAIDNAQANASSFRNAYFPDLVILMRGDSTITETCPQGDGWATVDLAKQGDLKAEKIHIKCSTVSSSIGCMTDSDFKARPQYANQDNRCNESLPFPLPKIQK